MDSGGGSQVFMLAEQEVYWPKYPTSLVPRGLQSQLWGWGAVSGSKELAGQSLHTWGSVRHSASEDKLGVTGRYLMLTSGLHVPVHVCAPSTHAGVYTSNAQIVKMDTVSSFSCNMNIKSHMYLIVPISTIICQSVYLRGGGYSSMECLPSVWKTLSLIPSTAQK